MLFSTVARATVLVKFRKSDEITRLSIAFIRYETHPVPEKASRPLSKSIVFRVSKIQGRSRVFDPM